MRSTLSRQSEFQKIRPWWNLHLLLLGHLKRTFFFSNVNLLPLKLVLETVSFLSSFFNHTKKNVHGTFSSYSGVTHVGLLLIVYRMFIFGKKQTDTKHTEKWTGKKAPHKLIWSWGHPKAWVLKMLRNQLLINWDQNKICCPLGSSSAQFCTCFCMNNETIPITWKHFKYVSKSYWARWGSDPWNDYLNRNGCKCALQWPTASLQGGKKDKPKATAGFHMKAAKLGELFQEALPISPFLLSYGDCS